MKQEHRDNLIKLADYILNKVTDKHFNMENYRSSVGKITNSRGEQVPTLDVVTFYSFGNCGTIGCALGWAPFALTEAEPGVRAVLRKEFSDTYINARTTSGNRYIDYAKVSLELFGIPVNSLAWEYLFLDEWANCEVGGTRQAFVERVTVYLSNSEMFKWKRVLLDGVEGLTWVHY